MLKSLFIITILTLATGCSQLTSTADTANSVNQFTITANILKDPTLLGSKDEIATFNGQLEYKILDNGRLKVFLPEGFIAKNQLLYSIYYIDFLGDYNIVSRRYKSDQTSFEVVFFKESEPYQALTKQEIADLKKIIFSISIS